MLRAERALLFAGYPKLNLLVRRDNQDVFAFYEHFDNAIGPLLTFYKRLID